MDVNPWKATDDCRATVAALIARDTRLAPDDEATRALASAIDVAGRGATVVALMPARTGTVWWHTAVMAAAQVRPVRGRVRFGISPHPAPDRPPSSRSALTRKTICV
ncbi:MAG: hypothetical protein ABGY75_09705 [Gemmataceae bacterium]